MYCVSSKKSEVNTTVLFQTKASRFSNQNIAIPESIEIV